MTKSRIVVYNLSKVCNEPEYSEKNKHKLTVQQARQIEPDVLILDGRKDCVLFDAVSQKCYLPEDDPYGRTIYMCVDGSHFMHVRLKNRPGAASVSSSSKKLPAKRSKGKRLKKK